LPTTVGVSGGITPTPIMPVGWLGPWTDPIIPHVSDSCHCSAHWLISFFHRR
jgi:hypothetical protein